MTALRRYQVLFIGAGALALAPAACGTEEIIANPVTYVGNAPGPDQGAFTVAFAPTRASYEVQPGSSPLPIVCTVFLDGRQLAYIGSTGEPRAYTVGRAKPRHRLPHRRSAPLRDRDGGWGRDPLRR